jgi:Bacterial translation initiation factor IF-2 associated region.
MIDDSGDKRGGGRGGRGGGGGAGETTRVRQSFSHGRSKSVVVEKKRKRIVPPGAQAAPAPSAAPVNPAQCAPEPCDTSRLARQQVARGGHQPCCGGTGTPGGSGPLCRAASPPEDISRPSYPHMHNRLSQAEICYPLHAPRTPP